MKRVFLFFISVIAAFQLFAVENTQNKTLRIVTSANFPPYEFIEGSKIVGIDIDIIREVLKRNGYDMSVEDMKFDSVIVSLQTGKGDIAASGLTVTEDRKRQVNFSIPYVSAKQTIIVRKDSAIDSAAALKGVRIGVQHGTTGDSYVTDNIQEPERFDDAAVGFCLIAG